MKKKEVKSVLFETVLKGRGVVNFDDKSQKYNLRAKNINHLYDSNDNVQYAKKEFFLNEKNEWDYKIIISDGALRNALFRNDYVSSIPHIHKYPMLYIPYIASISTLIRGFLSTEKEDNSHRKSSVCLPSAIQTNNTQSSLEMRGRSGYKELKKEKKDSLDAKDTTIFKKETIGDVTYETKGFFDIQQLQFISADQAYGRYSINPDYFKLFAEELSKNIPGFNGTLGFYNMKDSALKYPELGLLFSENDIKFLMVEFIKRLLNLEIKRSGAFAQIDTLKVKLVYNPLEDRLNNEEGWVDIKTVSDFEELIKDVDIKIFYEESNYDEAVKVRSQLKDLINDSKEARRKEKEEEKKRKEEAKKERESKKSEV